MLFGSRQCNVFPDCTFVKPVPVSMTGAVLELLTSKRSQQGNAKTGWLDWFQPAAGRPVTTQAGGRQPTEHLHNVSACMTRVDSGHLVSSFYWEDLDVGGMSESDLKMSSNTDRIFNKCQCNDDALGIA